MQLTVMPAWASAVHIVSVSCRLQALAIPGHAAAGVGFCLQVMSCMLLIAACALTFRHKQVGRARAFSSCRTKVCCMPVFPGAGVLLAHLVTRKGVEWREVEDKDEGPSLCHNDLQHDSFKAAAQSWL